MGVPCVGSQVQFRLRPGAPLLFGWVAKVLSETTANLHLVSEDGSAGPFFEAEWFEDKVSGHDHFVGVGYAGEVAGAAEVGVRGEGDEVGQGAPHGQQGKTPREGKAQGKGKAPR